MSRIPSSKELAEQLQARSVPRAVPWICWEEWRQVRDQLFSSSSIELARGLKRVNAWKIRGRVPLSVEITAALVEAMSHDQQMRVHGAAPGTPVSEETLRMLYALAAIRLVNGVVDPAQTARFAKSIASLANNAGIPRLLVDVRHEAAHNELPSLPMLRVAVRQALAWLCAYYWHLQEHQLADTQRLLRSLVLRCHPQASALRSTPQASMPVPAGSNTAGNASRAGSGGGSGGSGKGQGSDGTRDGGTAKKRPRTDASAAVVDGSDARAAAGGGGASRESKNEARRARKLALAYVASMCSLGGWSQQLVTVLLDGGVLPGLPSPPGTADQWTAAPSNSQDRRGTSQGGETPVRGNGGGNTWDGPVADPTSGRLSGLAGDESDESDADDDEEEEEEVEGDGRDGAGSSQRGRDGWLWARRRAGIRVWDTGDSEGSAVNAWLQVVRWLAGTLPDLPGALLRGAVARVVREEGSQQQGRGSGGSGAMAAGGADCIARGGGGGGGGGGDSLPGLMRWCGAGGGSPEEPPPPGNDGLALGGNEAAPGEQAALDVRLRGLTRWACLFVSLLATPPDQASATRRAAGAKSPNPGGRGDSASSASASKRARAAAAAQEYMQGLTREQGLGMSGDGSSEAVEEGRQWADMRAAILSSVLQSCLMGGASSRHLKDVVTCILQNVSVPASEGAKIAIQHLLASGKAGAAVGSPASAVPGAAATTGVGGAYKPASKSPARPAVISSASKEQGFLMGAADGVGGDALPRRAGVGQAQADEGAKQAGEPGGHMEDGTSRDEALRAAMASQQQLLQRLLSRDQAQPSRLGDALPVKDDEMPLTTQQGPGITPGSQPQQLADDTNNDRCAGTSDSLAGTAHKRSSGGQGMRAGNASLTASAAAALRSYLGPQFGDVCEPGPGKRWRRVAKWRPCAIGLTPSRLTEAGEVPDFWSSEAVKGAPLACLRWGQSSSLGGGIKRDDDSSRQGEEKPCLQADGNDVSDSVAMRGEGGTTGGQRAGTDMLLMDASFIDSQGAEAQWDVGQVAALLRTSMEVDRGFPGEEGVQSPGADHVEDEAGKGCNVMLQGDSYATLSVTDIAAVAGAVRLML
eukprot:jgi/Mesvir1/11616/Mv00022-RA.1